MNLIKTCEFCHATLHGRTDQRFCNDTCRNTFNRQKRQAEKIHPHENAGQIIATIKRNYEILKQQMPTLTEEKEECFCDAEVLYQTDFNDKFFTSIHIDRAGDTWYCVFERGYRIDGMYCYLKDFPEQAEL